LRGFYTAAVALFSNSADPFVGIIFLVVGLAAWLVASALRKVASPPRRVEGGSRALPSFLFSELKGAPHPHIRTIYTKIKGVSFKNPNGASRQQIIRSLCHPGDALLLMRDPNNPVDRNAIGVIRISRGPDGKASFGDLLGYLSKEIAQDLAPFSGDGPVGFAEIIEVTGDLYEQANSYVGANIRAEIYLPDSSSGDARKSVESDSSHKRKRLA
jgi:hypothetical protein